MHAKINSVLEQVKNSKLQNLLIECVKEDYEAFTTSPAACGNHHSYDGGLLDHSCSTGLLAGKIADHFIGLNIDRLSISKDICIVGAFLHDIGKIKCYRKKENGYEYTQENKLFHHIPIGFHVVASVSERMKNPPSHDVMKQILHIIVSHHGRIEYSSNRLPQTDEARIVAEADLLDAFVNASKAAKKKYQL